MSAKDHVLGELVCFNEAKTQDDFVRLSQFFDPECRLMDYTDPHHPGCGNEAVRDSCAEVKNALPDFRMESDELLEVGTCVVAQVRMTGTHTGGPFRGHAATGASLEWFSCSVYKLNDGGDSILEEHFYYDGSTLDSQLTGAHGSPPRE